MQHPQKIIEFSPDIVCLQELNSHVDVPHFESFGYKLADMSAGYWGWSYNGVRLGG